MLLRAIFFFSFIFVVELYAAQAFLTISHNSPLVFPVYIAITVIILSSLLIYFNFKLRERLHLPRQLLMAFFFLLFIPNFFISLFLIIEDVARLVKAGIQFIAGDALQFGLERSVVYDWFAIIATGLLMVAFLYGALFNVYKYKLRKVNLKLVKLPKAFHGLKVIQISDIHSGSLSDKNAIQKAIDRINKAEPDLIFFTGDLVNNIAAEAVEFIDVFRQLRARHGVYSVLGNHDYGDYMYWPDPQEKIRNLDHLKSIHQEMGWRLLLNEHVQIEKDGEKIIVAGVENWSAQGRFHSYGKLEKTLQGLQDAFTVLLLSHDPSHWEGEILNHPAKVDITFSGHTHGMQFGFEFWKFKWSPVKYFYKQWAGLYKHGEQYLYVNRGFGVIGYPGRVGILPEITLFTLSGEKD